MKSNCHSLYIIDVFTKNAILRLKVENIIHYTTISIKVTTRQIATGASLSINYAFI